VDELDVADNFIVLLKQFHQGAEKDKRKLSSTPQKKQDQLEKYFSSIEMSPSSLKIDRTITAVQKLMRTTHTQTEGWFTQQRLDIKRVDAAPEKIQVTL
jgi:hypothetical protein